MDGLFLDILLDLTLAFALKIKNFENIWDLKSFYLELKEAVQIIRV